MSGFNSLVGEAGLPTDTGPETVVITNDGAIHKVGHDTDGTETVVAALGLTALALLFLMHKGGFQAMVAVGRTR